MSKTKSMAADLINAVEMCTRDWTRTIEKEERRIEAKNKTLLKEAEQAEIAANGEFTAREWREVVSPDGVKCFITVDSSFGRRSRGRTDPAASAP